MPTRDMVKRATVAFAVVTAGALSSHAFAATRYVATWGVDNPDCSRKAPCRSVAFVINSVAGTGDRVIVGPGSYGTNTGMTIDQERLKLVSSNGAGATTLVAQGGSAINILADKVVVGQRRKGFTIRGFFSGNPAINVDAVSRARIEGNLIRNSGNPGDATGISITDGDRVLVRGNRVEDFNLGLGILATVLTDEKHQVLDNHFNKMNSNCVQINHLNTGNIKISGNEMLDCSANGLAIGGAAGTPGVVSRDTIRDNLISGVMQGIQLSYIQANVQRNAIVDADTGIYLTNGIGTTLKDNLLREITTHAVRLTSGSVDTVISGNTLFSATYGIQLEGALIGDFDTIRTLSRNNVIADCEIHIVNLVSWSNDTPLEASRNYWGPNAEPDGTPGYGDCVNSYAADAEADGDLRFSPSGKANRVRYKSKM